MGTFSQQRSLDLIIRPLPKAMAMTQTKIFIICLVTFCVLVAFREHFEIRPYLKAIRLRYERGHSENLAYCDRLNVKKNASVRCGKTFDSAWVKYLHVFNISDEQVRKGSFYGLVSFSGIWKRLGCPGFEDSNLNRDQSPLSPNGRRTKATSVYDKKHRIWCDLAHVFDCQSRTIQAEGKSSMEAILTTTDFLTTAPSRTHS